jgi:DNA modification methylase
MTYLTSRPESTDAGSDALQSEPVSPSVQTKTILNGDCRKVLPGLPTRSANFILTDPPYVVRYQSKDGRRILNDDNDSWLKPAFAEMFRVLDRDRFAVSFYGWPKADEFIRAYRAAGFRVIGHLMFPKRYTSSSHLKQSLCQVSA